MLRDPAWHATDALTRAQLAMVRALGDDIGLTADEQRAALGLAAQQWQAWNDFLTNGPLPADPALPDMMLRLARTAFRLSLQAERSA